MSEQTTTKVKPEVHYKGPLRISEWWNRSDDDPIDYVAHLELVLDHPRLGVCPNVRTSVVVVWPDSAGNFETRNTRYVRVYTKENINGTNQDS